MQFLCGLGIHDQHIGYPDHECDGRKVRGCIEWHLAVKPGVHCMGGSGGDADGVAIRHRFGDRIGSDIAASARPVFHQHRTQTVFDTLGQYPRRDVDRTTGCVRNDEVNRPALRVGVPGGD